MDLSLSKCTDDDLRALADQGDIVNRIAAFGELSRRGLFELVVHHGNRILEELEVSCGEFDAKYFSRFITVGIAVALVEIAKKEALSMLNDVPKIRVVAFESQVAAYISRLEGLQF